jgi:ABC-2 type transport system ATP-binding protein
LQGLPGVVSVRREGDAYSLAVQAAHVAIPALLQRLEGRQRRLARLTTRQASLEDVFVTLTGRHLGDGEAEAGAGTTGPAA